MVKHRAGFTLVEVVIVMAISSTLAVIALMGQSQLRQDAQLSDTVERVKNNLIQVRNEANTTVNIGGSQGGQNSASFNNQFVLGKLVTFNPGASDYTVDTLVGNDANSQSTLQAVDRYTLTMPYGAFFQPGDGKPQMIVFARDHDTGALVTYTPPSSWNPAVDPLKPSNYPAAGFSSQVALHLQYPGGKSGTVTVDTRNGNSGQITRSIP